MNLPEAPACVHWFVIASPNGPVSLGKCKRCKVVRDFANAHFLDAGLGLLSAGVRGRKAASQRHRAAVQPRQREMRVAD